MTIMPGVVGGAGNVQRSVGAGGATVSGGGQASTEAGAARTTGSQSAQAGQSAQQNQAATGGSGAQQGQAPVRGQQAAQQQMLMHAKLPRNFSMKPGQTMWGRVTGRQGKFLQMQFGKFSLRARTELPFSVGQRIQLAFTGNNRGGLAQFRVLSSLSFSRMNTADLTQALLRMNLPVNDKTMNVARGLVEFRIPLTPKNIASFSKLMSSMPRPMTTTDFAAASFLRLANIPLTTNNVMVLSNFIAQHPMLGAQLFELQAQHGGFARSLKDKADRDMEILEELSGTIENFTVNPGKQNRWQMARNMRNMAREEGIERIEYGFGGSNMEEGWKLMKILRDIQGLSGQSLESMDDGTRQLLNLVKAIEHNLRAHSLINQGRPETDLGFFFLQVPLKLNGEGTTAEVRIEYHDQGRGRVVDPENTKIEFDVNTEYMGQVHVDLKVRNGNVRVDLGFENEELSEFVENFTPVLRKNIENLGYTPGAIRSMGVEEFNRPPMIEREDFESMEKIDVNV